MHVVVVGAGVIGVTTAYYLSQSGCRVTVVDRATEVADGASHANGGQLSYSFTDALAKPEFVARIPGLLAGRDNGSKMRLAPALLPWGIRFLTQCTSSKARNNTLAVLKTAMRSADLMSALKQRLPFDFSHREAGKLVLLSNADELRAAEQSTELKRQHGCDATILSAEEAAGVEPALQDFADDFVAAVYSQNDEVADARLFTIGLKKWLEQHGDVSFRLGESVGSITANNGHGSMVSIGDEHLQADATVVCTGAWSPRLLKPLGIDAHIYPVRGYSITLPPGPSAPDVSVTALRHRIVFSRINGSMRIAGFADFKGFSTADDEQRLAELRRVAKHCAPEAADYRVDQQHAWGGFRPMTPDGRPRVGATRVSGLYLNTGHGMLGWTLACASGYDVAQSVIRSH
ncbi:MAG: FAD-dependent oxidoreductase [Gammaproteobacteria bacterium]|nr:FAD-dependent oxidoreductase [Gammaproteobacteria bacterium]